MLQYTMLAINMHIRLRTFMSTGPLGLVTQDSASVAMISPMQTWMLIEAAHLGSLIFRHFRPR